MISPQPSSSVLRTSILICSSLKLLTLCGIFAARPRHVGQHDRVVPLQLGQRREQPIARLHHDFQPFIPQLLDQIIELARRLPVFDQQHQPLALHVRERRGHVVLRDRVGLRIIRDEAGFVGIEIGLIDFLAEREHRFARLDFIGSIDERLLPLARLADDRECAPSRSCRRRSRPLTYC